METPLGNNHARENVDAMSRRALSISLRVSSASCDSKDQKTVQPRPVTGTRRTDYRSAAYRSAAPDSRWIRPRVRTTGKTNMFIISNRVSPMKATIHSLLCALLICSAVAYTPASVMAQDAQAAAPTAAIGEPGTTASYRIKDAVVVPGSTVRTFTLALAKLTDREITSGSASAPPRPTARSFKYSF